jgi:DeoR/GlpR family transcriptional regulator of sugar metabolism
VGCIPSVIQPEFQRQLDHQTEEKQRIAARAARSVRKGDSIVLGGGTLPYLMARQLEDHQLRVLTNSLAVAETLIGSSCDVHITGGRVFAEPAAFSRRGSYRLCSLEQVDTLVTGESTPRDLLDKLAAHECTSLLRVQPLAQGTETRRWPAKPLQAVPSASRPKTPPAAFSGRIKHPTFPPG